MRASIFFVFALLAVFAFAQETERFTIDNFSVNQGQNVEVVPSVNIEAGDTPQTGVSVFSVASCTGLIGCARDMKVSVSEGAAGRSFTSEIFPDNSGFGFAGSWEIATQKNGASDSTIQYDGADDSFDDEPTLSGLGGFDVTDGGLSTSLRFFAVTDQPTSLTVELYSPDGGICSGSLDIAVLVDTGYSLADITIDVDLDALSSGCDQTNIGAIVMNIPSADAADVIVRQISVFGLADPSASPSPSPSASPSLAPTASNTPSPSPSSTPAASPSPSRTPSPSGPCIVFCECPSFTCAILYDSVGSYNDVDLDFRTSQLVLDDSDDTNIIVVASSGLSVSLSPITFSLSSISPITTIPSISPLTFSLSSFSFSSSSSSSASTVAVSVLLVVIAALF